LLTSFKRLDLDEITKEDLLALANVVKQDSEMDEGFVHNKLVNRSMIPWRVETDRGNTIVVVEIKQKKTEKILYIWYLSGKGVVGHGHYILDTLEAFARLHDCVAIEAFASLRWGKYLSRPDGGFNIKHVFVRKEL